MNVLNLNKGTFYYTIVSLFILFCSNTAFSQSDLAKQYHNPLGSLKALPMQLDLDFNAGADKKTAVTYTFQPIFPITLSKKWTLVSYTILPLTTVPSETSGGDRHSGLGDLEIFLYFTPTNVPEGKLIWGIGPNLVIPIATNANLGSSKWLLGPAISLGIQKGSWTAFGLFDNVWSVGGWGDEPVNEFNLQYYITYQFPGTWFLISNYIISSDWNALSSERWNLPLGAGVGSLIKLKKRSAAAYIQSAYNVVRPTNGSNWSITLAFELIF